MHNLTGSIEEGLRLRRVKRAALILIARDIEAERVNSIVQAISGGIGV
jgi:hypothetical protein